MRKWLLFWVLLAIISTQPARPFASGALVRIGPPMPQGYAVVIGINQYNFRGAIAGLEGAVPDAKAIFGAITDQSNGLIRKDNAILLTDSRATRPRILESIAEAMKKASSDSNQQQRPFVLVYFAGHSTYVRERDDVFLASHDATAHDFDTSGVGIARDVAPLLSSESVDAVLIADGCNVGDGVINKIMAIAPRLTILASSKQDEVSIDTPSGGIFTKHLAAALGSHETDLDQDGFISAEEAFVHLYPDVVHDRERTLQHPSISGARRHQVMLARAPRDTIDVTSENGGPSPLQFLGGDGPITINGNTVDVKAMASDDGSSVRLMGNLSGVLSRGVNYIDKLKQRYVVWLEGQRLTYFANPYKNSYAVLVAIDDYERKSDPEHRGPTGYGHRDKLVAGAESLRTTIEALGFPQKNILTFYNEAATSKAIEAALQSFWVGGQHADADRVLFYFGGHGDSFTPPSPSTADALAAGTGVLITYDFDRRKPTLTGLLMKDLTGRHAENIAAHHMLVTLDACSSGLAVYDKLGDTSASLPSSFRSLSVIRNDTAPRARNVLVAGKENQGALWNDGGIFTQALIKGLSGQADANKDRIIQFSELAQFVRNEVANESNRLGARQQAMDYRLDAFGSGNMLFLLGSAADLPSARRQ